MVRGLIGKKLGMTSVFTPEGHYVGVTVVQAGPCVVTQVKREATDGYSALQVGFGEKKAKKVNKPEAGHLKKSGGNGFAVLKEIKADNAEDFEPGQSVTLDIFKVGERVDVSGDIKGRGFSGVVKRHGFGGGRKTHGGKCYRIPGSIGCSAWPSRVTKGKRMPGQYGVERRTARNLQIVDIIPEENIILIKGAVPGSMNGLLEINKLKFTK